MPDPRFHRRADPIPLNRLADIAGAELAQGADPDRLIEDVAPLDSAGPADIAFVEGKRNLAAFKDSGAGACIAPPALAGHAPDGMAVLLSATPIRAYAAVAHILYPEAAPPPGVDPTAHVDPSATIGEGTWIAAGAVIGAGVEIGRDCRIGPNAVIGDNVVIGDDTHIEANASVSHCLIGNRVRIRPGAVIGARGFGFDMSDFPYRDVPQLGRVLLEDEVEIGANSSVDRGTLGDTVIGQGSKLDNQVMIGHNARLGRGCVLVSQSGIAGSTVADDFVVLAAQAGVAGHLHLGKGAQIAAASGVMRDVEPGAKVGGLPAIPVKEFFRLVALWQRQLKDKGGKAE